MASFNRVVLVGNLTRDPEMRTLPSGLAVSDIGLAVNDRKKNAVGDWVDEVTFIDITLWGRQAEIACEYLTKGSPALIEGRLKLETWEDKTDGHKRSKLKVIGEKIVLLRGRNDGGGDGGSYSRSASQSSSSRAQVPNNAPPPDDYDYGPPPGEDVPF